MIVYFVNNMVSNIIDLAGKVKGLGSETGLIIEKDNLRIYNEIGTEFSGKFMELKLKKRY